jgi:hypothetical protein
MSRMRQSAISDPGNSATLLYLRTGRTERSVDFCMLWEHIGSIHHRTNLHYLTLNRNSYT